MDAFNYLSVLLSIILGLAITQILKGVRGMVLARGRVRLYWPSLVLAAFLFMLAVQMWWSSFGLSEIKSWNFGMFTVVLLQTTTLYLLAAIVLPDFFGEQPVDLHKHYFEHHRLFFGLFVVTLLISLVKSVVISGHLIHGADLAFHIGFIAVALAAAVTRNEVFHKVACVVSALAFGSYIALLFTKLPVAD